MNPTRTITPTLAALTVACLLGACSRSGDASPAATPAHVPHPAAGGAALASRLCAALRAVAPTVQGLPDVGARAQVVMAVASAFDADAAALRVVSSDIDTIASEHCAEVRAPLLAATRAATLQEAVR